MQLTVDPHGRVMKPVRLWDISASLTQMEARCLYIMTGEAADAVIKGRYSGVGCTEFLRELEVCTK